MKTLMSAVCAAALALPLAAQTTTDSPLVAAAKAALKDRKPGATKVVITNDNLVRVGGHVTTTTINNPLPPPPVTRAAAPTAQQLAEEAIKLKAEMDAKANNESADQKAKKAQALIRAAADYYGESIEPRSEDPAAQERVMSEAKSKQPQSSKDTTKPPQ